MNNYFLKKVTNLGFFLAIAFSQQSTWALIDPVFPSAIKDRVTLWRTADSFFDNESFKQSERPIWIHMGDSLSTGWASQISILDRVKRIESGKDPLFEAGSFKDIEQNLPRAENTWYAGPSLDGGLFGFLERVTQKEWVIYSTARTGSLLKDPFRDTIDLGLIQENQKSRVKVVTMTLGSNDLCIGSDPTIASAQLPDFDLHKKLETLKASYPNADFVVFAPGDLPQIKKQLFESFDENNFSHQIAKKYCEASLKLHCPAIFNPKETANIQLYRDRIIAEYKAVFQNIVDPFESELIRPEHDIRNLVSGDCFHPSKHGHKLMYESAKKFLIEKNPSVFNK
jgi:hypothetical protein